MQKTGQLAGVPHRADETKLASRNWRVIAAVVAFWTGLALLAAMTSYVARRSAVAEQWWPLVELMVAYYGIWAIAAVAIYRLTPLRLPIRWHAFRFALLQFGIFAVLSAIHIAAIRPGGILAWFATGSGIAFLSVGAIVQVFVVVAGFACKNYRSRQRQERAAARLALDKQRAINRLNLAQLDLISTQIAPHFIFNALNGVTALIETGDRERALSLTVSLSDLLRSAITLSRRDSVSLADDLHFATQYLELARLRNEQPIDLAINVEQRCWPASVPPVLLQPIVENSIKHRRAGSPVHIRIDACVDKDDYLVITVSDDNGDVRRSRHVPGTGFGHDSIRQRLQLLHGDRAALECREGTDGGYTVTMVLPFVRLALAA